MDAAKYGEVADWFVLDCDSGSCWIRCRLWIGFLYLLSICRDRNVVVYEMKDVSTPW